MHSAVWDYSIVPPIATWLQRLLFSYACMFEGLRRCWHPYWNIFFPKSMLCFSSGWKIQGMFSPIDFGLLDVWSFPEATSTCSQWMIPGCLCFKDKRSSYSHTVRPPNSSLGHVHYLVQILLRATVLCCTPCLTGNTAPKVQNKAHKCKQPPFSRKLTMTAVWNRSQYFHQLAGINKDRDTSSYGMMNLAVNQRAPAPVAWCLPDKQSPSIAQHQYEVTASPPPRAKEAQVTPRLLAVGRSLCTGSFTAFDDLMCLYPEDRTGYSWFSVTTSDLFKTHLALFFTHFLSTLLA